MIYINYFNSFRQLKNWHRCRLTEEQQLKLFLLTTYLLMTNPGEKKNGIKKRCFDDVRPNIHLCEYEAFLLEFMLPFRSNNASYWIDLLWIDHMIAPVYMDKWHHYFSLLIRKIFQILTFRPWSPKTSCNKRPRCSTRYYVIDKRRKNVNDGRAKW